MDINAQLVRLAELINVSAGTLRDLSKARSFDGETKNLNRVADDLERLSAEIERVGFSGLPV